MDVAEVVAVSGWRIAVRYGSAQGGAERMMGSVLGRAVIAMTAVRSCACVEPGKVIDLSDIRPSTDVMAITSLPDAPANHPVSL